MEKLIIPLTVILLIGILVFLTGRKTSKGSGCCGEFDEPEKKVTVKDRKKSHYPFKAVAYVDGMTCEDCARKVENALNILPGVWADVDISSHKAIIRTKSPVDERLLKEAVINAGYAIVNITY